MPDFFAGKMTLRVVYCGMEVLLTIQGGYTIVLGFNDRIGGIDPVEDCADDDGEDEAEEGLLLLVDDDEEEEEEDKDAAVVGPDSAKETLLLARDCFSDRFDGAMLLLLLLLLL